MAGLVARAATLTPAAYGLSFARPKSSSVTPPFVSITFVGFRFDRPASDLLVERLAFEVIHDEVVSPVLLPDVIQRADVWMREGGNSLGLAFKARFQFGIGRGQNLDGDRAIEARVAGLIDLAEPTGTER